MKVLFWGTGKKANTELDELDNYIMSHIDIVGFINGNLKKGEKQEFRGYTVISKYDISLLCFDYVCILSYSKMDIIKSIIKNNYFDLRVCRELYEICNEVLLDCSLNQYLRRCFKPCISTNMEAWNKYLFLKKKYSYVYGIIDNYSFECINNKKEYNDVWILWLQGIENAPDIVKICINSVIRNMRGAQIHVIDLESLHEYINLPNYVWEKWNKKIITNTMLSDLIRLQLLNKYGGLWLDATIYFTGECVPEYINNNELFMYQIYHDWYMRPEPCISANWLIYAVPGNKLLRMTEQYLLEYWKNENELIDYYIFHYFFAMAVEFFEEEWNKVPYFSREPAMTLYRDLNNTFSYQKYNAIIKMSDFHKLTYKIPIDIKKENSLYYFLYENI